jgi:sugar-specific transcriptional regulator TrmB
MAEEHIESLMDMGLTRAQAIVYLTCLSIGDASAKEIWKSAHIGRQDIYRVLDELQKKGIIEKAISTPTEFRATRIQDALSILLNDKAQKYLKAEKKAKEMLDRLSGDEESKVSKHQFILTEQLNTAVYKMHQIHEGTCKCVDAVNSTWSLFRRGFWKYSDFYKRCSKQGIEVRFIVERPKDIKEVQKTIGAFNDYDSFKLRFARTPLETTFGIYDMKEAIFFTSASSSSTLSALFTNNTAIIATLEEYFNFKWNDSIDWRQYVKQ